MKRSNSLQDLQRGNDAPTTDGMRRVRSQQDMQAAGRASGTSTPGTPPAGSASRVPMLSEKELREHFNMPLNEVAKKFGMCTTALKKLCRKYGVMQWPHRKLRSLEKKIASLRAEQRYTTDGGSNLDDEIRKFELQREALVNGDVAFDDVDFGIGEGAQSPANYGEDDGFFPGSQQLPQAAFKGNPNQTRTLTQGAGAGAQWDAAGGAGAGKALSPGGMQHVQLKQLEDENTNLRELSRSLMKERQELVNSLNTSNTEMEQLRALCQQLSSQLSMANGGSQPLVKLDPSAELQPPPVFAPPHHVGKNPPQQQGGGGADWMQRSPFMSPGVWSQGSAGPGEVPPIPGGTQMPLQQAGGGGGDDGMQSLSWMAPDFDLDELV